MTMTEREAAALRHHNQIFKRPAIAVIRLPHLGMTRWHVVYGNGHCKWDYECGSASIAITEILMDGLASGAQDNGNA